MKNITEYLMESQFARDVKQCKTFGDFFCLYTGNNSVDEFTEDEFDQGDYGYLFNREDISYEDFMKWLDEVEDNKITKIKPNDNNGQLTFKMGDELFDLDFSGDE